MKKLLELITKIEYPPFMYYYSNKRTLFDQLDQIISASQEVNNCDFPAGSKDIQLKIRNEPEEIDRDAGTSFHDAYINHNANTDRSLTKRILRDTLFWMKVGNPNEYIWFTNKTMYNYLKKLDWLTANHLYGIKVLVESFPEQILKQTGNLIFFLRLPHIQIYNKKLIFLRLTRMAKIRDLK